MSEGAGASMTSMAWAAAVLTTTTAIAQVSPLPGAASAKSAPVPTASTRAPQSLDSAGTAVAPLEIKVLGPSGEVVDWDRYLVFEEVPGVDTYTLEVTSPPVDSCDLGPDAVTIGASGGSFTKSLSTFIPAANPAVQCAGGYCKIQDAIPVRYVGPANRITDRHCVPVHYTYTWQIRTAKGQHTAITTFVPTLSNYKLP